MPGAAAILIALLMICLVSSTKEGRAAARVTMRRYARPLIPVVVGAWAWIIYVVATR